jgi:hypothetical protein
MKTPILISVFTILIDRSLTTQPDALGFNIFYLNPNH